MLKAVMTLSLKKRKNQISLLTLEDCILVKKVKRFLAGIILSGSCLVCSTLVFAGNTPSSDCKIALNDICIKLGFIERKILFEPTKQLLDEFNSILVILKGMILIRAKELEIKPEDITRIFNSFKIAIERMYSLKTDEKEAIARLYEEVRLFSNCCLESSRITDVTSAPKLKPKMFKKGVLSISMNDLPPLVDKRFVDEISF